MTVADNYTATTSLDSYFPSATGRQTARLWSVEKLLHDLAAMGVVTFFEGPGTDPTVLTGYANTKLWLKQSAGVQTASGTVHAWDGVGSESDPASWPALTSLALATHLTGNVPVLSSVTYASQAEAEAGTDNTKLMTSLRVKQQSESFRGIAVKTVAALTAALAIGGEIYVKGGSYAMTRDTVVGVANTRLFLGPGASLNFATVGANHCALSITASNVAIEGPGSITGPSGASYVSDEDGIQMLGASTSSRLSGLTVSCKVSGFGSRGVYAKWVNNIDLTGFRIETCAYAGWIFESCNHIKVRYGYTDVRSAPGTGGNAYGGSFSHDSTGYGADAFRGTPQAANPFCVDAVVEGCTFIGPYIWQALDTHGVYGFTARGNKIYAAASGISVPTGSAGGAENYAGWDNFVDGNLIDYRLPDGTNPGVTTTYGITADGPSTDTFYNVRVHITNNTIIGYGVLDSADGGAIRCSAGAQSYVISGNIIELWAGACISIGEYSGGFAITGNTFGGMRYQATSDGGTEDKGYCVALVGSGIDGRIVVEGNVHNPIPNVGYRAAIGVGSVGYAPTSPAICIGHNDFAACALVTNLDAFSTHGVGAPGEIRVTSTSGDITVSLAPSKVAPGVPIVVRFQSLSGNVTSVTFTNSTINQIVILVNDDTTYTVTMTRTAAALGGSANYTLNRYDTLMMIKGNSGWYSMQTDLDNG